MRTVSLAKFHALKTVQAGHDVFALFVPAKQILAVAEIAHLRRADSGDIEGFQRPEIRAHVDAIAEYLRRGDVLFPNAIILALAPGTRFCTKRGTKNHDVDGAASGVLEIPMREGRPAGWIVDGQQRALALSRPETANLLVPVVAFVSGDLGTRREQFILVNKARPLDRRLIDELLPTVGAVLPRDLTTRRIPSALCAALNDTADSPFQGLIKRPSGSAAKAVITDSVLIALIKRSLEDPRGALAAHVAADSSPDLDAMYGTMVAFWSAVRDAFPESWGLPPERSRLMHGAGIAAMGVLMDQIMTRPAQDPYRLALDILRRISPLCHWTSGRWQQIDRTWNDLQCTRRDIKMLTNHLVSLEREASRAIAA